MDTSEPQYSYRRFPGIPVPCSPGDAVLGTEEIIKLLSARVGSGKTVLVAECYPGVDQQALAGLLSQLHPAGMIHSDDLAVSAEELDRLIERELTEDPVFGIMTTYRMEDFFPPERLDAARAEIDRITRGLVVVYGVGASLVTPGDVLLYADITRWEIQLRFRQGMDCWHTARRNLPQREKFKRGYFAEWRWADRVKEKLLPELDLYLDMTTRDRFAMVSGDAYRTALDRAVRGPFRTVPYFDPGVWGGDWMKRKFNLPENGSNYAWSFDGVPEENSLLLEFGDTKIQTPAMNLVLFKPRELLGDRVHGRFGKEFPIRFDMLDTINGQNLSLQVHPLTEYIQQTFHMHYTQDESYYILDTQGEDACVYLGIKTGTDKEEMLEALKDAQSGAAPFPAERYVNRIPVKKHDHLLIPAGTVHCSGANAMVLEISATPYIFTFKLWDWGRLDLDGKPRPIHLEHGKANIQWDRDTQWVEKNQVNPVTPVYENAGGSVERTGLHQREFLDTYRIATGSSIPIRRNGSVHVMNLVEGKRALIVSPQEKFPPFPLFYGETCILPEAAGEYSITSPEGEPIKVILACVRS